MFPALCSTPKRGAAMLLKMSRERRRGIVILTIEKNCWREKILELLWQSRRNLTFFNFAFWFPGTFLLILLPCPFKLMIRMSKLLIKIVKKNIIFFIWSCNNTNLRLNRSKHSLNNLKVLLLYKWPIANVLNYI